ncbi:MULTISPECIES: hypothetical protein [unclassified Pseudonocardia]|uniref:hypothetical protein n=1 Tax=unclassified Pseudonocardia TaxID=2619320 RepID=UPI0001FFDB3F|nr:hypothetical protein [Pseudonocardia sp. Ae707_Ps1]OLM08986.1 hypothetical protein Ae707Ps1_5933c [Pseudonocardia sp. Ae707_Ps1]
MNARLVRHERSDLVERRREIVERMEPDEATVRSRGDNGSLTPEERDLLVELEGIDFLLGDGA